MHAHDLSNTSVRSSVFDAPLFNLTFCAFTSKLLHKLKLYSKIDHSLPLASLDKSIIHVNIHVLSVWQLTQSHF